MSLCAFFLFTFFFLSISNGKKRQIMRLKPPMIVEAHSPYLLAPYIIFIAETMDQYDWCARIVSERIDNLPIYVLAGNNITEPGLFYQDRIIDNSGDIIYNLDIGNNADASVVANAPDENAVGVDDNVTVAINNDVADVPAANNDYVADVPAAAAAIGALPNGHEEHEGDFAEFDVDAALNGLFDQETAPNLGDLLDFESKPILDQYFDVSSTIDGLK